MLGTAMFCIIGLNFATCFTTLARTLAFLCCQMMPLEPL